MGEFFCQIVEPGHLLAVRFDDFSNLTSRELFAPLSGTTFAKEALGAFGLLAKAVRRFLFLQALKTCAIDCGVELLRRRSQQKKSSEFSKCLRWILEHVFIAHNVY